MNKSNNASMLASVTWFNEDRTEDVRRVAELMIEAGLVTVTGFQEKRSPTASIYICNYLLL